MRPLSRATRAGAALLAVMVASLAGLTGEDGWTRGQVANHWLGKSHRSGTLHRASYVLGWPAARFILGTGFFGRFLKFLKHGPWPAEDQCPHLHTRIPTSQVTTAAT